MTTTDDTSREHAIFAHWLKGLTETHTQSLTDLRDMAAGAAGKRKGDVYANTLETAAAYLETAAVAEGRLRVYGRALALAQAGHDWVHIVAELAEQALRSEASSEIGRGRIDGMRRATRQVVEWIQNERFGR